ASASSFAGTSRPSGLGGLEVDDQIQFGWLQHRQIRWLRALKDFSGVHANLPVSLRQTGAITHQTASRGGLAQFIDCRDRRTRGQREILVGGAGEDRTTPQETGARPFALFCRKALASPAPGTRRQNVTV